MRLETFTMPSRRFEITVVRISGESRTFNVHSHYSVRTFLQWVREDMNVPMGRWIRLVGDDEVIDPVHVGLPRPPFIERWPLDDYYVPGQRAPRVELRRYGIYDSCTLNLVVT